LNFPFHQAGCLTYPVHVTLLGAKVELPIVAPSHYMHRPSRRIEVTGERGMAI